MWRHWLVCSGELPVRLTRCNSSNRFQHISQDLGVPGCCSRNKVRRDECEATTEPPRMLSSIKLHKKKQTNKNNNIKNYFRFEIVPGSLILLALEPLGVLLFTSTWGMTPLNFTAAVCPSCRAWDEQCYLGLGDGGCNAKKQEGQNKEHQQKGRPWLKVTKKQKRFPWTYFALKHNIRKLCRVMSS